MVHIYIYRLVLTCVLKRHVKYLNIKKTKVQHTFNLMQYLILSIYSIFKYGFSKFGISKNYFTLFFSISYYRYTWCSSLDLNVRPLGYTTKIFYYLINAQPCVTTWSFIYRTILLFYSFILLWLTPNKYYR